MSLRRSTDFPIRHDPRAADRASLRRCGFGYAGIAAVLSRQTPAQLVEVEVDHRRREQGQHLGDEQAADDRPAERLAELRAGAVPGSSARRRAGAQAVVIRIGRSRWCEACAHRLLAAPCPCSRSSLSATSTIMMPFFFTMPISRMMAMMPITLRSWPASSSASSAPTPGRRQGREDRRAGGCSSRRARPG